MAYDFFAENNYPNPYGNPNPTASATPYNVTPPNLAETATSSAIRAGTLATSQLPSYMTSLSNIGTNIKSKTAGEVPQDVISLLQQQGAEGNFAGGRGSNASYLRALGLTSLGLQKEGQQDFESILPKLPGFGVSQSDAFQTSAPLAYEQQLQPEVFRRGDERQSLAQQMQREALGAAHSGLAYGGGGWSNPTNAWSGLDAFGFPNSTTATLPGQTSAGGVTVPGGGGGGIAYGGGGPIEYY